MYRNHILIMVKIVNIILRSIDLARLKLLFAIRLLIASDFIWFEIMGLATDALTGRTCGLVDCIHAQTKLIVIYIFIK